MVRGHGLVIIEQTVCFQLDRGAQVGRFILVAARQRLWRPAPVGGMRGRGSLMRCLRGCSSELPPLPAATATCGLPKSQLFGLLTVQFSSLHSPNQRILKLRMLSAARAPWMRTSPDACSDGLGTKTSLVRSQDSRFNIQTKREKETGPRFDHIGMRNSTPLLL